MSFKFEVGRLHSRNTVSSINVFVLDRSYPSSETVTPPFGTPPLSYPSLHRFPSINSLRPSDSISMMNESIHSVPRSSSTSARGKQCALPSSHGSPVSADFLPRTDLKKKHFERRLIRLTASTGLPLSWVDNMEWITFCDEFIPPPISRKVLTKRVLHNSVADIRDEIKRNVKGKEVTLQGDGWTGQNHHHLIINSRCRFMGKVNIMSFQKPTRFQTGRQE